MKNPVVSIYLCQVVDVRVLHGLHCVDSTFERVDLLMSVSYEDFPTALRQHDVQDGCTRGSVTHTVCFYPKIRQWGRNVTI